MYSKLRSLGDGGLRSRIKVFSLTGILGMEAVDGADDEISREELLVMLKEGIGLEEEDIDIINDAEKYQEKVLEHLTALKDQIAEELDALPGIDSEEVKEVYEEILKELQEKRSLLDEIETEVIDDLAKLFPDFGSTSCH
jgi:hypothetical protein